MHDATRTLGALEARSLRIEIERLTREGATDRQIERAVADLLGHEPSVRPVRPPAPGPGSRLATAVATRLGTRRRARPAPARRRAVAAESGD